MEPIKSSDGASKILTWNPERFIYTDPAGTTVSLGVHRSGALAIDLYAPAFLCPEAVEWQAGRRTPDAWTNLGSTELPATYEVGQRVRVTRDCMSWGGIQIDGGTEGVVDQPPANGLFQRIEFGDPPRTLQAPLDALAPFLPTEEPPTLRTTHTVKSATGAPLGTVPLTPNEPRADVAAALAIEAEVIVDDTPT